MEQRTDNWLEWRRQGIGGSDAAAILGISPWTTRYQLWEDKTGRSKPKESNWAQERGTAMEPVARAWYELKTGIEMRDGCVVHSEFPFMRCSLDGGSDEARRALEIKCPGQKDHDTAKEGRVPDKYFPQCQHALIVTGYDSLDYVSFQSHQDAVIINVKPDAEWCKKYFEEAHRFWFDHVVADVPPELSEKDFQKMPKELANEVSEYLGIKSEMEDLETKLSELKKDILEKLGEHPRAKGFGLSVNTVFRKGTIDYAKAGKELKLDFEQFRKPGTVSVEFRQIKA